MELATRTALLAVDDEMPTLCFCHYYFLYSPFSSFLLPGCIYRYPPPPPATTNYFDGVDTDTLTACLPDAETKENSIHTYIYVYMGLVSLR